jgi:PleD family two-component response regulator
MAAARAVEGLDRPVTASAGIALLDTRMGFAEAIKAAALRLYEAKAAGRNRAVGPRDAACEMVAAAAA